MRESILSFDCWKAFTDTLDPYRKWRLTADAPDLDARSGDYLLETSPLVESEIWDGMRFQLRSPRNEKRDRVLRELEEWQAAQLFGGSLPEWPAEGRALDAIATAFSELTPHGRDALLAAGSVVADILKHAAELAPDTPPAPEGHPALAILTEQAWRAWMLTQDLPGRLRSGDLVVPHHLQRPETTEGALVFELSREELEALREQAATAERLAGDCDLVDNQSLLDRRRWGLSAKKWRSGWWVVRRVAPGPVSTVRAGSDDAAIFELIHAAGGLMPAVQGAEAKGMDPGGDRVHSGDPTITCDEESTP